MLIVTLTSRSSPSRLQSASSPPAPTTWAVVRAIIAVLLIILAIDPPVIEGIKTLKKAGTGKGRTVKVIIPYQIQTAINIWGSQSRKRLLQHLLAIYRFQLKLFFYLYNYCILIYEIY